MDISHQLKSYQQKPRSQVKLYVEQLPAPLLGRKYNVHSGRGKTNEIKWEEGFPVRRHRTYLFDQNIKHQVG